MTPSIFQILERVEERVTCPQCDRPVKANLAHNRDGVFITCGPCFLVFFVSRMAAMDLSRWDAWSRFLVYELCAIRRQLLDDLLSLLQRLEEGPER